MTPRLRLRAAPERTLESLYRRHAADVYRYALMMLASAPDAEDVTQTTFLNAYRALLRGESPRAAGPWLRTIAHNLCLQHVRQAARRPRAVELEDETEALVSEPEGFLVEDLTRALRHIPVQQRTALLMRELEGRPIAEIASVLDTSTSAVETLLFRARRALREQLEGGFTCEEAEQMISRQLDGQLGRTERGKLRAHLRECQECMRLARSMRAQRGALKSMAAIPLPGALAWSRFAAGAAATGAAGGGAMTSGGLWVAGTVASKLVSATVLALVTAGAGYVAAVKHPWSASATLATPARVSGAGPKDHPASFAARPTAAGGQGVAEALRESTRRTAQNAGRTKKSAHRSTATAPPPPHLAATALVPAAASQSGSPGSASHGRGSGHGKPTTKPVHVSQSKKSTPAGHRTKPAHPSHPATPSHAATPSHPTHPSIGSNSTHTPNPSATQQSKSSSPRRAQALTAAASLPSTSP